MGLIRKREGTLCEHTNVILGRNFTSFILETDREIFIGVLEWRAGMACWNGVLEWRAGMACWNDVLEWRVGVDSFSSGVGSIPVCSQRCFLGQDSASPYLDL